MLELINCCSPILFHLSRFSAYCHISLEPQRSIKRLCGSRAVCFLQAVGVHCAMGRGRTGTMLACYLVAREDYSPDKAIDETRRRRPGSIETRRQEQAVRDFADHLRNPEDL